jgi:hypothetical protein
MANDNLSSAKKAKNDEFYTQYGDIEKEMNAYLEYNANVFRDKIVLLPCDDPDWSNFTKYFAQNFEKLGLKKLISTSYAPNLKSDKATYQPALFELESHKFDAVKSVDNGKIFTLEKDETGDGKINVEDLQWTYLEGTGDFRSEEVKRLRDEADFIVTNPPFSLFREFVAWIQETKKHFLILGNMNAITYKEIFPLIKENKMWAGNKQFGGGMNMLMPTDSFDSAKAGDYSIDKNGRYIKNIMGVIWFTNIEHGLRHSPLTLMTTADNLKYNKAIKGTGYIKYDNYDAIEVPLVAAIPSDYKGVMGVPITFLGKYNPDQFEILDLNPHFFEMVRKGLPKLKQLTIKGQKDPYARVLIRHKKKGTK